MFTVIKIFITTILLIAIVFLLMWTENAFADGPKSTTLICDKHLPKKIPDVIKDHVASHIFHIGIFGYSWYFSSTDPLKVQSLIVEAGVGLTRYTWEKDGWIYTVRQEVNENICAHKIRNGYTLTRMYKLLVKQNSNQLGLDLPKQKI